MEIITGWAASAPGLAAGGAREPRPRGGVAGATAVLVACSAFAGACRDAVASEPARPAPGPSARRFPTVDPEHRHVRALLENALRYVAPANKLIDPVSGYPVEGWNQDPQRGLFLRSFTQLTAIGQGMELFAAIAAGQAETPDLSRDQALAHLNRLVENLRNDQRDPRLGTLGLLGNFLDLATGKRLGPLASDIEKSKILQAFGPEKGEALWRALQARGWIVPRNADREAAIQRVARYGYDYFDGPLAPFGDKATRLKVMDLLDERVVMVIFGDNANLSASAAKTIGTLLLPELKDRPEAAALRRTLEQFLEDQREGYVRLYDAKEGLFYFGWDATRGRHYGWDDLQGNWTTGHMDYFVNEFRGPALFIALRHGTPTDAIKNLGFKMKPYRMQSGKDVYSLAPWEGSAFQALGFELSMGELGSPSWRALLESFVALEVDYATRNHLPGLLSESYTGDGVQYTGNVGIPEITVSPRPRITDAASLYTLGASYNVAPVAVERFLAAHWPIVSTLLTDHGPWEGYNVARKEAIPFQTSVHTFSLILGFLGTGSDNMRRYLDSRGLGDRLAEMYPTGGTVDLLSEDAQVFAWSDKASTIRTAREQGEFRVQGDRVHFLGVAFVPTAPRGIDLSGGLLTLRYRSAAPMDPVVIALKPSRGAPTSSGIIPKEIFSRFAATGAGEEEIQVRLPATPGLTQIREVVITHEPRDSGAAIDFAITRLGIAPAGPSSPRGR